MRIAIVTMVYNEQVHLPIWLRHYRAHCPGAALFVLDHGSNDGSTRGLAGASLIPLRRTPLDEIDRAAHLARVQRDLLRAHEVVIVTDCDELLVADPARHRALAAFLAAVPDPVIAPVGLHVLHDLDREPPLDLARPLLGQRGYVQFESAMCKPTIGRVPLRWQPGLHHADRRPAFRSDLFLFHLRHIDRDLALRRLALTRAMAWSERSLAHGHSVHHRHAEDEYLEPNFRQPTRAIGAGAVGPFDFTEELERLASSMRDQGGVWSPDPPFWRGRIAAIPDRLRTSL